MSSTSNKTRVVFCCPCLERPTDALVKAMEASVPALDAAGFDHQMVFEVGCPYISSARATMLRKALDAKADIIVFLDYDLSFPPDALVKLLQTEGEVVAGTYRFKAEEERYMGRLVEDAQGRPIVRGDGCVKAELIPAGFLKVAATAIDALIGAYPELCYGVRYAPTFDLFNHGAHEGVWWGEDYAFSRRWREMGGEIWVVPDLDITHHSRDAAFPGNYRRFLLKLSEKIRSEKAREQA